VFVRLDSKLGDALALGHRVEPLTPANDSLGTLRGKRDCHLELRAGCMLEDDALPPAMRLVVD